MRHWQVLPLPHMTALLILLKILTKRKAEQKEEE